MGNRGRDFLLPLSRSERESLAYSREGILSEFVVLSGATCVLCRVFSALARWFAKIAIGSRIKPIAWGSSLADIQRKMARIQTASGSQAVRADKSKTCAAFLEL